MGLQEVATADRIHISVFGARNAGKSSLVNALTGQKVSIVSDTPGTTTDAVHKTMELLPLGPVVITDTAGYDDEGELGKQRMEQTRLTLYRTDLAILVLDGTRNQTAIRQQLTSMLVQQSIPYVVVYNKLDQMGTVPVLQENEIAVSAVTGEGIEALKEKLGSMHQMVQQDRNILADLISQRDVIILVTPIDESAPKGRLILPQQQTLREILDCHAIPLLTQPQELPTLLELLQTPPRMVITDSQAFGEVNKCLPKDIPLTSFSILMARYKGFLDTAVEGVRALRRLQDGAKILIAEGCTHHRQCNDIGTVKLPKLLQALTGKQFAFSFTSGGTFPEDLSPYALVVHCGGCMRTEREMLWRMRCARAQGIPFTNYGIALAECHGILHRSLMGKCLLSHDSIHPETKE